METALARAGNPERIRLPDFRPCLATSKLFAISLTEKREPNITEAGLNFSIVFRDVGPRRTCGIPDLVASARILRESFTFSAAKTTIDNVSPTSINLLLVPKRALDFFENHSSTAKYAIAVEIEMPFYFRSVNRIAFVDSHFTFSTGSSELSKKKKKETFCLGLPKVFSFVRIRVPLSRHTLFLFVQPRRANSSFFSSPLTVVFLLKRSILSFLLPSSSFRWLFSIRAIRHRAFRNTYPCGPRRRVKSYGFAKAIPTPFSLSSP